MNDDTIELRQPAGDPVSLRAYVAPIAAAFGETIDDASSTPSSTSSRLTGRSARSTARHGSAVVRRTRSG